jgi:peptidoglycan/LPS O-acetylase OafA/YrhL
LCYEEQFYLVMGLLVAMAGLSAAASRRAVIALLGIALAWNVAFPHTVYGVFIEYWAAFAFGCLTFYRLCELPRAGSTLASTRSTWTAHVIDGFLAILAIASACWLVAQGGFPKPLANGDEIRSVPGELMVAALVAIGLILVRSVDPAIARSAWFKPLQWLGKITFSLYLVHQFNLAVGKKVASIVLGGGRDESLPGYVVQVVVLLVIGTAFWYCCERPFLNKPLGQAGPDPRGP